MKVFKRLDSSAASHAAFASTDSHHDGLGGAADEALDVKQIGSKILVNIQQRIYYILKELFEIDRANLVRRNMISFLRKALRVMFTSHISKARRRGVVGAGKCDV